MRYPYWARKRIAELDVEKDFVEINHLAFEVRFGSKLFTHTLFSLAFARQMAVPSIANVVYGNGNGPSIQNTRKRNNDTLLFFGEFYRHGNSPEGMKVAEQLNRIHSRFPISNNQNLYTLATLMCEPIRMSLFLTGKNIFSQKETRSLYLFWKMVAEMLHITDIPKDEHAMYAFYLDYEKQHFGYTDGGHEVLNCLIQEFADRWFPKFMHPFAKQVYLSLFDDHLLETYRLKKPSLLIRTAVRTRLRFQLAFLFQVLPDPKERSIIDLFNEDYRDYHIRKAGPLQ